MKIKLFVLSCFVLIGLNCFSSDDGLKLTKDKKFPKWMRANKTATAQTSGIAYFKTDEKGDRFFLTADDIGRIFNLTIKKDGSLVLKPVQFSEDVKRFLSRFPKWDFEEITYDKYNNEMLLSIEGNDPDFRKHGGIFKLKFQNNDFSSGKITAMEKLNITPEDEFLKYTHNNVGFEGLAVTDKYIFAGLESTSSLPIFSSKTKIYIINKKTLAIIKELDTEELEISSISGLFCPDNSSLLGINRNAKLMVYLKFDQNFNVTERAYVPVPTCLPDYPGIDYSPTLESITMDDADNVYFVEDPFLYLRSDENIISKLDKRTKNYFVNFIPIIYKFNLNLHQKR